MRADCAAAAAPAAAAGPAAGAWRARLPRGLGWATVDPACPPALWPVICGCCCAGTAEVRGVGACRAMAEAGGPPDGRADCCGAARGVCAVRGPRCGDVRRSARSGHLRRGMRCGDVWRSSRCGHLRRGSWRRCLWHGRRARCGRCVRRGSCGGGARGRRSSRFPSLFLRLRGCGCRQRSRNDKSCRDSSVPLEHNTTSCVACINQRREWRAGFACEGAAAYMGLT